MKSKTRALVVGSMTAFVGILSPATVFATGGTGTCYAVTEFDHTTTVDGGSPLIVRYLADNEGSLNSNAEVRNFYHLKQQAYSLVGKGRPCSTCTTGISVRPSHAPTQSPTDTRCAS